MKNRLFNNLLKSKEANKIIEEYMLGKHSKLTDKQLQKVIDKKNKNQKFNGRGAMAFGDTRSIRQGK